MRITTHAPKTIRNGLKWRPDAQGRGRPRWDASKASRDAGLKGRDLKDLEGQWLADRGVAISICDARHRLAALIREAGQPGPDGEASAARLRQVLEALQPPKDDDQRLRRQLTSDLVAHATALLAGQDVAAGVASARAPRSAEALVEAYFAAADAGKVKIKTATYKAYRAQKGRFLVRFPGRAVAGIRRMELKAWYHDELLKTLSIAGANMVMGAVGAWFKHALDLEWISASPVQALEQVKAAGRRVFWTLAEEQAFVAWCDAHAYADVADAVVAGLWTAARQSDTAAADLADLGGDVWTFTPIKTERRAQEAMPGITTPFRARVERRRLASAADPVRHLNATPYLWDSRHQRRHSSASIGERFREAKARAIADGDAVPGSFAGKRLQDTRDTCITRLYEADVPIARMWTWTGHSQDSIEAILKEHYLVLRQEGQMEMARQLEAWFTKEGVRL